MKKCIYCGAELPDDSNFCFSCAKAQSAKQEVKVPALRRRKLLGIGIVLTVIIAAAIVIYSATGNKIIEADGAEMIYRQNGSVWRFLLRNSTYDNYHWQTPQGVYKRVVQEAQTGAIPLQLYVYDEETGSSRAEELRELIDYSEITVTAAAGSDTADYGNPQIHSGYPEAALVTDIIFNSGCNENEIAWTLHMKNGDRLVLREQMLIKVMNKEEYSWETTSLDTSEKLQKLIDRAAENDEETEFTIYLGPYVYEDEIVINGAAVNLIGCDSADGSTVFRGGIRINTSAPYDCTLEKLCFEGGGIGITAAKSCFVINCTFIGLETGIDGRDGSWPMPEGCTFENCGIGLHINSTSSTSKNSWFGENTFRNNKTAVLLEQMPSQDDLYFVQCVFEGNETDIDSRVTNRILYEM